MYNIIECFQAYKSSFIYLSVINSILTELMKTCISCEYLYNYDNIQDTNSTKQRNTSFGSTEILEEQESSNHVESTLSPCLKRKEWKNDWKNWDFKKNFNSSPKMNKK